MFGEKGIYGNSMVHIGDKQRLVLPKFTYVEKGDSLLIIDRQEFISVCTQDVLEKEIKSIEELYKRSNIYDRKKIELDLLNLYKSIIKQVSVDSQHRINLGGIEIEEKDFLCIGAKDRIILNTKVKKK